MEIIEKFRELAKNRQKTIVLPEGEEERVIKAAIFLDTHHLVKPILLGNPEKIKEIARSLNTNPGSIEIMNPEFSPYQEEWTDKFFELRKHKNICLWQCFCAEIIIKKNFPSARSAELLALSKNAFIKIQGAMFVIVSAIWDLRHRATLPQIN